MADFQLFPGDKKASPGDAVIQFLIDEQKKGNERFKAVGNFLADQMEKVFPRFKGALEDVTSGAEERRQKLNELFGLGFGEEDTSSVGEKALGFGVASIKGISGIGKGIRGSINARPIGGPEGLFPALSSKRPTANISELTSKGIQGEGAIRNIGGIRPRTDLLEFRAIQAQAKKQTQTKVKDVQKNLDALLIEEVNPLAPTNLVKELAAKGIRAKSGFNEGEGVFFIAFKSAKATADELVEFGIVETESGPVLSVNFNSPLIKPELQQVFKERFGNAFLDDFIEENAAVRVAQRLKMGVSKDAPLPVNLSFYGIRDFNNGLQLINRMLDIANER